MSRSRLDVHLSVAGLFISFFVTNIHPTRLSAQPIQHQTDFGRFSADKTTQLPLMTIINPSPRVVDQFTDPPDDMVAAIGGGPYISFKGLPGHLPGDSERTSVEVRAKSKAGNDVEETSLDVEMKDASGVTYIWRPSTSYPAGVYISNDSNPNKIYQNEKACRSSSYGFGPKGLGLNQIDGSCVWMYRHTDNDGKSASLISGVITKEGGKLWGQATDVVAEKGAMGSDLGLPGGLMVGQEIDVSNFAKDCPVTPPNCLIAGLFIAGASKFEGTSGILGGGQPAKAPLYHQGITLLPFFASDVAFNDDTNAKVGFQSNGRHSEYTFQDLSDSPTSIFVSGRHSFAGVFDNVSTIAFYSSGSHVQAAFKDDSTSEISLHIQGTHRTAALFDNSVAGVAIALRGKYNKQISGIGFEVDSAGNTSVRSVRVRPVNVVALPLCNDEFEGSFAAVNDANVSDRLVAVRGGGHLHVPVYCNGVTWVVR